MMAFFTFIRFAYSASIIASAVDSSTVAASCSGSVDSSNGVILRRRLLRRKNFTLLLAVAGIWPCTSNSSSLAGRDCSTEAEAVLRESFLEQANGLWAHSVECRKLLPGHPGQLAQLGVAGGGERCSGRRSDLRERVKCVHPPRLGSDPPRWQGTHFR